MKKQIANAIQIYIYQSMKKDKLLEYRYCFMYSPAESLAQASQVHTIFIAIL